MRRWLLSWFRRERVPKTTVEQFRRLFPSESRLKWRWKTPDARWRAQ